VNRLKYFLIPAACFLILILLAYKFSTIALYFVLALIVSAFLKPITNYIGNIYFLKRKIPRPIAILIAYIFFLSTLTGFVTLFIPMVTEQIDVIKGLKFDTLLKKIEKPLTSAEKISINTLQINKRPGFLMDSIRKNVLTFVSKFDYGNLISTMVSLSSSLSIGFMSVLFISFFFIYQQGLFRRKFLSLIPNQYFELSVTTLHKVEKLLANYLLGLSIQIFSIFFFLSIGLSILGVNYAITIALLAAIINIVPYIGPLVGTSLAIILSISLADFQTPHEYILLAIKIVIAASIVHVMDNFVSQPLIFSKSVKAHPLEIFTAIFVAAELVGPAGMILAIPVYTVMRVTIVELNEGYDQYEIFQRKK